MFIETFELERNQSLYENTVDYNLTESGIHPYTLRELLDEAQQQAVLDLRLGYGQTNGDPALRSTIAGYYPGLTADNILLTNGSAEANFIALWHLLQPGDELVLMQPNYQLLQGLARSLGCTVKPFRLQEERGWAPDFADLESQVSIRTGIIALCNPNNPTGAVLSKSDASRIVELARHYDCYLFVDEVYAGSELDGVETETLIGYYEKTVVSSGLAKSLAHPGLRIGWLAGPAPVIDACWHHHDYTSISTGIISQYVANIILAVDKRQAILERGRRLLRSNLKLLEDWVAGHGETFRLVPPRAGGMAFLGYDLPINSSDFSRRLREEHSVLVVAGDWFGMDRFLRIGIGGDAEELMAGLKRIDRFIEAL